MHYTAFSIHPTQSITKSATGKKWPIKEQGSLTMSLVILIFWRKIDLRVTTAKQGKPFGQLLAH